MTTETKEEQLTEQTLADGVGSAYHRLYHIDIDCSFAKARESLQSIEHDFNSCSPQLIAKFEKISGSEDKLKVGDEFQIHISGPWNGPVRVIETSKDHVRFVTLEGHMEAGEICFSIRELDNNRVRFEIESLARSKNMIVDFVYDKVPIAKMMQTQMWTSFCLNFADIAKEKDLTYDVNDVVITTEKFNEGKKEWIKLED